MNIFKSLLRLFIRNELTKRREALKQKLNEQINRTSSQNVIARNLTYLAVLEQLDGKGIDAVEKVINKM